MNKNQPHGNTNKEERKDKETYEKRTDDKRNEWAKTDKHRGNDGAVLGDINSDAKKGKK